MTITTYDPITGGVRGWAENTAFSDPGYPWDGANTKSTYSTTLEATGVLPGRRLAAEEFNVAVSERTIEAARHRLTHLREAATTFRAGLVSGAAAWTAGHGGRDVIWDPSARIWSSLGWTSSTTLWLYTSTDHGATWYSMGSQGSLAAPFHSRGPAGELVVIAPQTTTTNVHWCPPSNDPAYSPAIGFTPLSVPSFLATHEAHQFLGGLTVLLAAANGSTTDITSITSLGTGAGTYVSGGTGFSATSKGLAGTGNPASGVSCLVAWRVSAGVLSLKYATTASSGLPVWNTGTGLTDTYTSGSSPGAMAYDPVWGSWFWTNGLGSLWISRATAAGVPTTWTNLGAVPAIRGGSAFGAVGRGGLTACAGIVAMSDGTQTHITYPTGYGTATETTGAVWDRWKSQGSCVRWGNDSSAGVSNHRLCVGLTNGVLVGAAL